MQNSNAAATLVAMAFNWGVKSISRLASYEVIEGRPYARITDSLGFRSNRRDASAFGLLDEKTPLYHSVPKIQVVPKSRKLANYSTIS